MIGITTDRNDFIKTRDFIKRVRRDNLYKDLHLYGEMGVQALSKATPIDTGLAAHSWVYRVVMDKRHCAIEWFNTDTVMNNTPVVILVQYGHGTGTGGYVQGRDFINPAMRDLFDQIVEDIWKKVMA